MGQCGFADRKKQRTTALSTEEERVRVRQGWQHWDRLLWLAGCGKADDVKDHVLQPERWEVERRHAVISMSDQVPVWLMPAGDRKLVSQASVRKCGQARKRRASRAKLASGQVQTEEQQGHAEEQPRQLICNAGTPGNAKARFTLVARQLVEHYFDEQCPPTGSAEQTQTACLLYKKQWCQSVRPPQTNERKREQALNVQ